MKKKTHSFHYTCNCHHVWYGPLSLTPGPLTHSSLSALITFWALNLVKYFMLGFPIAVAIQLDHFRIPSPTLFAFQGWFFITVLSLVLLNAIAQSYQAWPRFSRVSGKAGSCSSLDCCSVLSRLFLPSETNQRPPLRLPAAVTIASSPCKWAALSFDPGTGHLKELCLCFNLHNMNGYWI